MNRASHTAEENGISEMTLDDFETYVIRSIALFFVQTKSTFPNVSHQGTYSILFTYQRNAIVIHYSERKNALYICALIFFYFFTLQKSTCRDKVH